MSTRFPGKRHLAPWAGTAALVLGVLASATARGEEPISYRRNVAPILQEHCMECHQPGGRGYEASGLDLTNYQNLMKGTKYGPVIVPGDIYTSNLLLVMTGQVNPQIRMPFHRLPVPVRDSTTVMRWIQQGARDN